MSSKILNIAFLWHQHQPYYKDLVTGKYAMPWVRLHAVKDYYDMAAILEDFPAIRSNFNLVPSLLIQLEDYAQGGATDPHLELTLKPANDLTGQERLWILENFFMANQETMIAPHARYAELSAKRGRYQGSAKDLERMTTYFTRQDFLDLQVWFNLTWMDLYWRKNDPLVKNLFQKGKSFNEEDKALLIAKQREICGMVAAKHKQLQDQGQIEVSTTPFYHPILPLLIDPKIAKTAMPDITLPQQEFRHPEDAEEQIRRAIACYERIFGRKPKGFWPSEGSVSEDVAVLLAKEGVRWIATDEGILNKSLEEKSKYPTMLEPYRFAKDNQEISILFRHHGLSDAIGFTYTRWEDPKSAAQDFMKRLSALRDQMPSGKKEALVPVILDGENCWEFYKNDGWDFLQELYKSLSEDPQVRTVRISDYLEEHPPEKTLARLHPGSWINANYAIWIGHAEDNLAWDALSKTRNFLTDHLKAHPEKTGGEEARLAWEEIYIAEGSDWCWWYGEDHSSANDETFDLLFRKHLMNVYKLLGEEPPNELHTAIKRPKRPGQLLEPMDMLKPKLDGKVTSYFEWRFAGHYKTENVSSAMHKPENVVSSFYYGFDLEKLFFRLDLDPKVLKNQDLFHARILFFKPAGSVVRITLTRQDQGAWKAALVLGQAQQELPLEGAFQKVLELAIPFQTLGIKENEPVEFAILVMDAAGHEIERWPYQSTVTVHRPNPGFFSKSWSA